MLLHIAALLVAAASSDPSVVPTAPPSPPPPANPCGSIFSIVSRPSVTTGVCTVQPGHVVLENGYQNTVTSGPSGGVGTSYPQSLLRAGTFDPNLDFEFTAPSVTTSSAKGAKIVGSSDIAIGAKYMLGYSAKASWGVNGIVSIPTGTPAFSAGAAQYIGNVNWSYTLSPALSLSGTMGFDGLSGHGAAQRTQPYFAFIPSVLLTASLPVPGSAFGEYAYYSQSGPGAGAKSLVDFGYEVDAGPHLQFDLEYGISPTSINGQTQHYTGAGLSFMY